MLSEKPANGISETAPTFYHNIVPWPITPMCTAVRNKREETTQPLCIALTCHGQQHKPSFGVPVMTVMPVSEVVCSTFALPPDLGLSSPLRNSCFEMAFMEIRHASRAIRSRTEHSNQIILCVRWVHEVPCDGERTVCPCMEEGAGAENHVVWVEDVRFREQTSAEFRIPAW